MAFSYTHNGLVFSDLTVSKEILSANNFFDMSVSVKNNSGEVLTNVEISLECKLIDFTGLIGDTYKRIPLFTINGAGLKKGQTKEFVGNGVISNKVSQYFAQYPELRRVPVYLVYETNTSPSEGFGNNAEPFELEGLHLINARYNPQITDFGIERCIDGVPNDEGVDVFTTMQLALSDAVGVKFMQAHLYYAENAEATQESEYIDLTEEIPDLLIGVTDSTDLIFRQFSNGSNWDFLLVFGDQYESATSKWTLARAFANMHLSGKAKGGVCFGGFSSSTDIKPKLESYYEGFFKAGIHGVTNYSDGEIKTGGRWIDNRPIYRKILYIGNISASGTGSAPIGSGALGALVSLRAWGIRGGSIRILPFAHSDERAAAWLYVDGWESDDPKVSVSVGSFGGINDVTAIIEYTKASDEPVTPDDGTAPLMDADGIAVADAGGTPYTVRAYNADQYISAYTGAQIDTGIAKAYDALPIFGGTMTGVLTLFADPVGAMDAVTKRFMEAAIRQIELTPGEKGDTGVGIVSITIREVTDPDEPTGEYVAFTDSEGKLFIDANNNSFMTEV